jgi:hypothetical protein
MAREADPYLAGVDAEERHNWQREQASPYF